MARKYSNSATPTELTVSCSAAATSLTVASTAGLPASYPFTVVIDGDNASMEVVTVTNVVGTVLTVTRGQDSTAAVTHDLGATVEHCHTARDFSEPQVHIDATSAHGATGAVVGTTNSQTLSNKTIDSSCTISSSASLPNNVLTETSTDTVTNKTLSTGTKIGSSGTDPTGAWTAFTPSLTNVTLGNGNLSGGYLRLGNLVIFRITFTAGSTTTFGGAAAQIQFDLPVSISSPALQDQAVGSVRIRDDSSATTKGGTAYVTGGGARCAVAAETGVVTGTVPWTWATSDSIWISGSYEVG